MLLTAFLLATNAQAGPFTEKTSMGDWPETRVQRGYALPKGWLQLTAEVDHKDARAYRNAQGDVTEFEDGTRFHYFRTWLKIDQGFSRRAKLYLHLPYVSARLESDRGADVHTMAFGDAHAGFWYQPNPEGNAIWAVQLDYKAPSGVEWPSDFIGGPSNIRSFLTGTGITNLGAHLHGRVLVGDRLALRAEAGRVIKFPGIVGYVIETEGFGNGWLDPGDETRLGAELELQAHDKVSLDLGVLRSMRGAYKIGTSGASTTSVNWDLLAPEGSFTWFDLGASYTVNRHLELTGNLASQVQGTETMTFQPLGLEEFSPQPGRSWTGAVVVRW